MQKKRRKILIDLGADALADVLLDLTAHSDVVENRVARMTSSGVENLERFRRSLKTIPKEDHFHTWYDPFALEEQLTELLMDLEAASLDARQGVEAVFQIYRMDEELFEICDDSDGGVSAFFTDMAPHVFSRYASKCDDTEWLVDGLIDLTKDDPYGLRASLFEYASDFLTRKGIEILLDRLRMLAGMDGREPGDAFWRRAIEVVARSSGNAALFEEVRRAARGDRISPSDIVEIAKLYHETGHYAKALELLNSPQLSSLNTCSVRRQDLYFSQLQVANWERDRLLVDVHRTLGNREEWSQAAQRVFDCHRSIDTLATLVEALGEDRRERVIDDAAETILNAETLSTGDVEFLMSVGRLSDAATYVLNRPNQIRGEWYGTWTPVADAFMQHEFWLAATVIYRALLDSMLDRGVSKAYHHGIRYLTNLDVMADRIEDWRDFAHHGQYAQELNGAHRRKWSFWQKYKGLR